MKSPLDRGIDSIQRAPLALAATATLLFSCSGGDAATEAAGGASGGSGAETAQKVLHLPMRTDGPKSLDPVKCSTQYENRSIVNMMDGLVQYKYLARPPQLEPCLLAEMPKVSEDGRTWTFRLKEGVRFHDDECFPGGVGREVVAEDVFYSWKRMADPKYLGKSWWLFEDTIVGFDDYKAQQEARVESGSKFDYDAEVEGMKILDDHNFQVVLTEPIVRFQWVLAMPQTVVIAREAVEKYGGLDRNVVGTGPFLLESWEQGKSMTMVRNPNYRDEAYPTEHMPDDVENGYAAPAGTKLPIVDRVEVTMFPEDQPMWLQFRAGKIDYVQAPAEYYPEAVDKRTRKLKPEYRKEGIVYRPIPLLDFIFRGFNMDDPLVGGYTEEKKALRQAIACALDWDEHNETFYNGSPILYDGMIPPGLDGHPEGGKGPISYRPVNLERARELLAKAGYPNGEGLPPIDYYTSRGANSPEQVEMLKRHMKKINVEINAKLLDFSQLIAAIDGKQAQMFSFAWGSDYPDPENNLALFYGPNESPGSNHYNYKNAEYDRLYEQIRAMAPSPERTEIIERMRDMVMEDCPYIGSQARTRHYLINPWLKNFKPSEDLFNWLKYMDLDESKRAQG